MSKITFRADEELVERVERFDASKSEVMREALRAYLDGADREAGPATERAPARSRTLDDLIAERLDALLAERLDALLAERLDERGRSGGQDIDLTVSLEGAQEASDARRASDTPARPAPDAGATPTDDAGRGADTPQRPRSDADPACNQCGESLSDDHVYCPNCGEKASRRVFCECGDEVRTDWAYCPSCGRRTPAADVLEGS